MENGRLNKKQKDGFLTALATVIKSDPITSVRKHVNELKVQVKTVKTAIKQDLSRDLDPLNYAIWDVLEKKTNGTYHLNIGSFEIAIEEE